MSKTEFLAMGVARVQVGYDYYTSKYNTPGGELYDLKRAFLGAGFFAPRALAEMGPAALGALSVLLALFGFPEFTAEFLQGMIAELPEVIRHAKQPVRLGQGEGRGRVRRGTGTPQAHGGRRRSPLCGRCSSCGDDAGEVIR